MLFDIADILIARNYMTDTHYLVLAIVNGTKYYMVELETGIQSEISSTWVHNACEKIA